MAQPKRPNLAELAEAAGSVRAPRHDDAAADRHLSSAHEGQGRAAKQAPSRVGQKPITAFFPEHVRVQLKMMAAEQRRSMESLLGEALNDLFAKHGKPETVPLGSR